MKLKGRDARLLFFDCECRPLSWINSDYVSKEITAIAWRFLDKDVFEIRQLGIHDLDEILWDFGLAYTEADIVIGHYIRGFDLPLINGARLEQGMTPLSSKLSLDTKLDMNRRHGMSNSQENLAAELGVAEPKVHMTANDWREANRLTEEGLAKTRERVVQDVRQNMALYAALRDLNWLGSPKVWSPEPKGTARYHA